MAPHATLASGLYTITSLRDQGGFVSRADNEDKSLNPKAVVVNPSGSHPIRFQWEIKKTPNGGYILLNDGSPTGVINNALYAILTDYPSPEEWKIEPTPQHGRNVYTIVAADGFRGWVVAQDDSSSPIAVKPLIVFPTYPPRYPPTELFKIERVGEE